jgi:DNA-binding NarL/FixJ family response regulator
MGGVSDCGTALVVDRDRETRRLIEDVVALIGLASRSADTGEAALAAVEGTELALAVVEVELPGLNGFAVLQGLHEKFGEDLPVILVSSKHGGSLDRAAGLMLGADDYVVKPLDPTELGARVRRSLRRSDSLPHTSRASRRREPDLGLSPREHEILSLLAGGLSQSDIATRLVISPKTVATHIQRVLSKLGVRSRTQALAEAYRRGLVLAGS